MEREDSIAAATLHEVGGERVAVTWGGRYARKAGACVFCGAAHAPGDVVCAAIGKSLGHWPRGLGPESRACVRCVRAHAHQFSAAPRPLPPLPWPH